MAPDIWEGEGVGVPLDLRSYRPFLMIETASVIRIEIKL